MKVYLVAKADESSTHVADQMPMFSKPEQLAQLIVEVAEK
jgi:hypothetical protein